MKPEETVLFSDLDGTLLNSRSRISAEDRAAIDRYVAAGGRFALSTGRAPQNARRLVGSLPINAPSVVFNGAAAYDFVKKEYIFCSYLPREQLDPVLLWALEHIPRLDLQVYTEDEILYLSPRETANPPFLEMHLPARFTGLGALPDAHFIKCVLLPPAEYITQLGEKLKEYTDNCTLKPGTIMAGAERLRYYEIMPPDATKGSALRQLRQDPTLAGRTILAAGDYWNDYEVLREADVPLCPANAIDEIKALCLGVSTSNDEHSIAYILDVMLPDL